VFNSAVTFQRAFQMHIQHTKYKPKRFQVLKLPETSKAILKVPETSKCYCQPSKKCQKLL